MEMELEEWELLSDNNSITSRATEVLAPINQEAVLEDPDDALLKVSIELSVDPPVTTLKEKPEIDNEFNEEEEVDTEEDAEIEVPKVTSLENEFRDEVDGEEDLAMEVSKVIESEEEEETREEEDDSLEIMNKEDHCDGFNLSVWKWRLRGARAVSSIGLAAAATLLMLMLGGRHDRPNQNVESQIYAEDKRMEQMVQQATRLNQALSSGRGAPTSRATISFGGYNHGALLRP